MPKLFSAVMLMLIACALTSATPAPAQTQKITYRTYSNARYKYSIAYPVGVLVPQGEADNGDGQQFVSEDGRAKLIVFGANNVDQETTKSAYEKMLSLLGEANGGEVTYKVMKGNWFVVSARRGDDIIYSKTINRGQTLVTFILSYPEEQRETFDSIAEHLAQSFAR